MSILLSQINQGETKTMKIVNFAGQSNIPKNFSGVCKTPDETYRWMIDGLLHRVSGPAVTWHDGIQEYWEKGRRHRLDGPAYVYPTGQKEYWIEGRELTYSEWLRHPKSVCVPPTQTLFQQQV